MRLGEYEALLKEGTKSRLAYGEERIQERHRHRYEFNPRYRKPFEASGMVVAGASSNGQFTEILELKDHPWFIGVQFHPEFKSHFLSPHPLFCDFVRVCSKRKSSSV